METAVVLPPPPPPSATTRVSSDVARKKPSAQPSGGSSGRSYQLPQRFRAKREKNRQQQHQQQQQQQQFHVGHKDSTGGIAAMTAGVGREEMNLHNIFSATQQHALPIPFPLSPGAPQAAGGPIGLVGRGGILMFPTHNGQMITKIGPYKEPLLPSGPHPLLQPHHGGMNFCPLAHANMEVAMHAMNLFSPTKKDLGFKIPPPPLPPHLDSPKPPTYSMVDMHKARMHPRSESMSVMGHIHSRPPSTSSVGGGGSSHDASLNKLMKDLHRCEVSISRYQTMLNEHCDAGLRLLHQAFITLHIGLNAREKDIARELQMTRHTAGTILQHRHTTACVLRQLAEKAGELEDTQIHEFKKQIKQFVVDRKVDEEIGTTSRFIADPDDLLPHVMKFGRVVNRRHAYTSWEGDPAAAVEQSKTTSQSSASVFSSPPSSLPTTPSPVDSEESTAATTPANSSHLHSPDQKSVDSVFIGASPEHNNSSSTTTPGAAAVGVGMERAGDSAQREDQKDGYSDVGTVEDGGTVVQSQAMKSGVQTATYAHCNGDVRISSPGSESRGEKAAESTTTSDGIIARSLPDSPPHCHSVSSLSASTFDCGKPLLSGSSPSSVSTATKPLSASSGYGKARPPFSRRFATPIVVTHTRRSFNKSLPKNLDPKSTVTLLLSSSAASSSTQQQKHGKHKNQKLSFKRQFSPSRQGVQEEPLQVSARESPSSAAAVRLKGREKERELWRKRFNNNNSTSSSGGGSVPPLVMAAGSVGTGELGTRSSEEGGAKRSPEELATIQSRVRESLRAQGVFLYDPVTGTVPSELKREESVDSGMGRMELHLDSNKSTPDPKKKTPTQLRRERKKRQKERERRQKELDQHRLTLLEEGGGKQKGVGGGRGKTVSIDKTSASSSRTTSPLSSIGNVTSSDAQMESGISLSLSQSPTPPSLPPVKTTTTATGERREGKSVTIEGESQRLETALAPCNGHESTTAAAGSENIWTTEDRSTDVQSHSLPVKRDSGSSEIAHGDKTASIEWDISQRRQKGVNKDAVSSPLQHSDTCLIGEIFNHSSSSFSTPEAPSAVLSSEPAHSVTSQTDHNENSTVEPCSTSSVAHILKPKCVKDIMCLDLGQNGSDALLVINAHEE